MDTNVGVDSQEERSWLFLSELLKDSRLFFYKTLFMEGYDVSSNVYAVIDKGITIIDPGNDYTVFMELFTLGYTPSDVRKIILTHGHYEHVMGTFELLRYPGIGAGDGLEIILHEKGPEGFMENIRKFDHPLTITSVRGGEILDVSGFEMEVLPTPGHTMDSICLYHGASATLFSGDTVLPYAVAGPDPVAGGKIEYQIFTLQRLLGMKVENLLPGHGTPVGHEGKRVIEGNYAGVIRKIIGLETPWIEGAAMFAGKKYLDQCIFCCEKALEERKGNIRALELKASCLNDMGRFDDALEVFDKIPDNRNDNVFKSIGKGYALMGLGKYEESLTLLENVLKIRPDNRSAQIYKGIALYLAGRIEEALAVDDFQKEFVDNFKIWLQEKAAKGGESDPS